VWPGDGGLLGPAARGGPVDPLAALERGPLRPYYLLFGDETFLLERGLRLLRSRLLPGARGTGGARSGDQDSHDPPSALEGLAAPSLFGGTQVLVVRHADMLREDEQAAILEAL